MITVTRQMLEDLYSDLFRIPLPERFLFGVRGAVPVSAGGLKLKPKEQELDVCDDAIGFMVGDKGHVYPGSVDPGRYFTKKPMQAGGCAHMIEGQYRYIKGRHKKEKQAWQGRDVLCWRDTNRDGKQNPTESKVFLVRTTINLHYGGRGNTIGEYSAGCQIVQRPHWETFRDLTYTLFPATATYWLINVHSLETLKQEKRSPSVTVNNRLLPKTVPMWVSQENRVVAVVRSLLANMTLDDKAPGFEFEPGPPPALRFPNGKKVTGKVVQGRLVCPVSDVILALEPGAKARWDDKEKTIVVTSERVKVGAAAPIVVEKLEEANDDTLVE